MPQKDSETPDDIATPALVVENFDNVVCGYHLTHIKPKEINGEYLFRYFQTKYLNSYFEVSANGVTRYGLGVDKFNSALILNPPKPEQTAIANYLDRKTAEIDELIAQKERLLRLYEEEKTAIINQAVTQGIHPDVGAQNFVPLRDSGIDWLGEIPEHWKVKKLKYVSSDGLKNGIFKKSKDFGKGTKLINVSDVYSDSLFVNNTNLDRVICSDAEIDTYCVKEGDIFFVRSSLKREGIAKVVCACDFSEPMVFECHIIKVSPLHHEISFILLTYLLNCNLVRDRLVSLSITTTMTTISQNSIGNLEIAYPSKPEQTAIVQHIETETTRINAKIAKTKKIIALQKEYRSALISEVVTGKLKIVNG